VNESNQEGSLWPCFLKNFIQHIWKCDQTVPQYCHWSSSLQQVPVRLWWV